MISLSQFSPSDLGLPDRYEEFRDCQHESLDYTIEALEQGMRFVGCGLPPGVGKTLYSGALIKALKVRGVVLTITRGLQNQYVSYLGTAGMLDIRGKANYPCCGLGEDSSTSCRFGPAEGCRHHRNVTTLLGDEVTIVNPACTYEGERKRFQWSRMGVTNYPYWIRANLFGRALEPAPKDGPNPVELLILDEAHAAAEALAASLQVVVTEAKLADVGLRRWPKSDLLSDWQTWVVESGEVMADSLERARRRLKMAPNHPNRDLVFHLESLIEQSASIVRMQAGEWVVEMQQGTGEGRRWQFDCVSPGNVAESRLFLGIPQIVLISGTLRPQSLRMLNIPKSESVFREWPRQFPAHKTPVYHVRTTRMNAKTDAEGLEKWVRRIDEIIESRCMQGRSKGLVHTVSYKRQQYLIEHSRYAHLMLANQAGSETESAARKFEEFKEREEACVLVSPSFSTGWDFADDLCRFIIIAKLPFPDFRSKVMRARSEKNPQYTAYLCAQELQQMAGRGTRSEEDWTEVWIVDDSLTFFMRQNKALFADWFQVMVRGEVPKRRLG